MKKNGFTLIELVVVIVLLGILAATAAPKFINLKADAQNTTLLAMKASMDGASALVHSKSIVKGNHQQPLADNPTITLNDNLPLTIIFGYPRSISADWLRLIAIDLTVFTMSLLNDGSLAIYRQDRVGLSPSAIDDECITYYQMPANANEKPVVAMNPCT